VFDEEFDRIRNMAMLIIIIKNVFGYLQDSWRQRQDAQDLVGNFTHILSLYGKFSNQYVWQKMEPSRSIIP